MNAKLRDAIDGWERDSYGPGYWDGFIEGMVAANPKLKDECIVWQCPTCKELRTDVAFNSFSQPCCPHENTRLFIVKDPRDMCCKSFEEFVNKGIISWAGGRFWLHSQWDRASDAEHFSFNYEMDSLLHYCPFCGEKVRNDIDKD